MQDLIVLGSGGNAVDIAEAAEPRFRVLGFLDDNPSLWGRPLGQWTVLGPLASAVDYPQALFINGIGSAANFWKKPEVLARTKLEPERFATVVHPTAWVSPSARLGRGVALLSHVSVNAEARIDDHVIVLPCSVISHHDVIGAYTCITSGVCISGNVTVGRCCYLGTNSAIRGHVHIGAQVLVGMGSVVLHDVPDNQTVVGAPARLLRPTVSQTKAA